MASSSRKEERWSLAGATALVTGGSMGIGRAIVEELARFGASVHACARNEAELGRCLQEWEAEGLAVTVSACDVSVPAEREALVGRASALFAGKLSILVNNAAAACPRPATEVAAEEYSRVMATNLEACFHLSQLARPLLLKASGRGAIVNISTIGSLLGFPTLPVYSAFYPLSHKINRSLEIFRQNNEM